MFSCQGKRSMHRRRQRLRRKSKECMHEGSLANMCSGYRARDLFSRYCTLAYQAPPTSVSKIPNAFITDIDKLKITTARTMDRTCFTFAIGGISMVSPRTGAKNWGDAGSEERTCDSHAQRTSFLVSGEANDIQTKCDCSIKAQCNSRPWRQILGTPTPNLI